MLKILLFAIAALCSTFAVSGINFDGFIKKNHVYEARVLAILLILSLTYTVGSLLVTLSTSLS